MSNLELKIKELEDAIQYIEKEYLVNFLKLKELFGRYGDSDSVLASTTKVIEELEIALDIYNDELIGLRKRIEYENSLKSCN